MSDEQNFWTKSFPWKKFKCLICGKLLLPKVFVSFNERNKVYFY